MNRFLARLERTLGRFAIERLTTFIVGGMALVFVLSLARPEFIQYLTLDPARIRAEPWRLVTYLFLPTSSSPIWVLFALYWTWMIGSNLEQEWGPFKLNLYYLLGALGTTAAAWITKEPQGNFWLNTSLFFAFATVFPNYEIQIFFVIPLKVKWLGLLTLAFVGFQFAIGDLGVKAAIAVAFANYLVFFTGHLVGLARGRKIQIQQAARRTSFRPPSAVEADEARASSEARGTKTCAICGVKQADGADIRVCTCDKCGGPRQLCLEHARSH